VAGRSDICSRLQGPLAALAAGAAVSVLVALGCARWGSARQITNLAPAEAKDFPYEGISTSNASTTTLGLVRVDEGFGRVFAAVDAADLEQVAMVVTTRGARCEAGWPWRAVAAVVDLPAGTIRIRGGRDVFFTPGSFLPRPAGPVTVLGPLWAGFLVDSALFGSLLWAGAAAPGAVRRAMRRRRGCCAECGYPRGAADRCTECGAPVASR
jgi:hypothetical protein